MVSKISEEKIKRRIYRGANNKYVHERAKEKGDLTSPYSFLTFFKTLDTTLPLSYSDTNIC